MCISFCQLDKIGNNCTFRASSLNAPNNMNNFCPDKNLNFVNSGAYILNYYLYDYYYNKETDNECKKKCPLECKTEKYEISFENTEEEKTEEIKVIKRIANFFNIGYQPAENTFRQWCAEWNNRPSAREWLSEKLALIGLNTSVLT